MIFKKIIAYIIMISYSLRISGNVFRKTGIGRVVKLINTTEIKLSPYQGEKKKTK